ncbi:hypothetical protein WA158_002412 [Blastocystis sp. Blastoise]
MQRESFQSLKTKSLYSKSDERRKELIRIQKEKRNNALDLARKILNEDRKEADNENHFDNLDITKQATLITPEEKKIRRQKELMNHYLKRRQWLMTLQWPEWMNEIPCDLNGEQPENDGGWYVCPRLDGDRYILFTKGGNTYMRDSNGQFLFNTQSNFPGGSQKGSGVMLDCIYNPKYNTIIVYDIYQWNNMDLTCSSFDYRQYFISSKLNEDVYIVKIKKVTYTVKFTTLYECTPSSLSSCYNNIPSFPRNGLMFIYKNSSVETGMTPFLLLWKDQNTSQYAITTDKHGNVPTKQNINLLYSNYGLYTAEQKQIMTVTESDIHNYQLEEGCLVKVEIDGINLSTYNLINPSFRCKLGYSRVLPDSISKIIYQYSLRVSPLTIDSIIQSVTPVNLSSNPISS